MDNLRLSAVADRVVAWHNRHPLARRISAAQVHAIGYVALPFAAEAPPPAAPSAAAAAAQAIAAAAATPLPVLTEVAQAAAADSADTTQNPAEGSRLRERALARAREVAADPHGTHAADTAAALLATLAPATLKPDFSEQFIDTLSPRQVARFAVKHGRVLARAPHDGPVREVRADGAHRGRVPAQVYLLTAVIETDTRKSRVLLGQGALVLGRRIHSSPRCMALAALAAGAVGTPLWLMRPHAAAPANAAAASASSASSAPTAAAADPAAHESGAAPHAATHTAPDAAHAATSAASAAVPAGEVSAAVPMIEPPAAPPPETDAETAARRRVVSIVPLLSEEQKALAREQRQALMEAAATAAPPAAPPAASPAAPPPVTERAAPAARAPAPADEPPPRAAAAAPGPARPAMAAAPSAPTGPVFAVSTRALRTRAEADQVRVAMQALLQTLGQDQVQVDVLPQGDDWRVVALPFQRRADAEKGRALLASRGMRVTVLDF